MLSKDPKNSLELKENMDSGVYVKDLTSFVVKNATEIDHVMQAGKKNRSVGVFINVVSSQKPRFNASFCFPQNLILTHKT